MARSKDLLSRLASTGGHARLTMQVFRQERVRAVRRLAGNRYSEQTTKKKTFVNLVQLYVSIIGRTLVSSNPKVALTTFNKQTQPTIGAMQDWINQEIEQIDLRATFEKWVIDALFSVGVIKTGLATPCDAANFAWQIQAGFPFASVIDLDDFIFDVHARDMDEVAFIGHRFRCPLEAVKNDKRYNKKARDRLVPSTPQPFNAEGDEKIGMLGRGYKGFDQELEDMVDLWEFYLPRQRCTYTIADEDLGGPGSMNTTDEPLYEQDYIGPDTGPYRILSYNRIPGNPFPKGPIQDVLDLDEAVNLLYRKLVRQAQDSKTILAAESNEDVDRIKATSDGSGCMVKNPKSVQEMHFGGVDPKIFEMMKEMIMRFSWLSGNLETIGGLAPQANTLGQEELLTKNSNAQISAMQSSTTKGMAGVIEDLLWYHWHHPTAVQSSNYEVGGMSMQRQIHPWDADVHGLQAQQQTMPLHQRASIHARTADWSSLGVKIDPFSAQYQTPTQRAGAIEQIVTQIYVPMAQIADKQGVTFNFEEFLNIIGQYRDMPDLSRILSVGDPPDPTMQDAPTSGGQDTSTAPEKTTNIVRHSAGGNSASARETETNNMMAKAGSNGQLQHA